MDGCRYQLLRVRCPHAAVLHLLLHVWLPTHRRYRLASRRHAAPAASYLEALLAAPH